MKITDAEYDLIAEYRKLKETDKELIRRVVLGKQGQLPTATDKVDDKFAQSRIVSKLSKD